MHLRHEGEISRLVSACGIMHNMALEDDNDDTDCYELESLECTEQDDFLEKLHDGKLQRNALIYYLSS